MQLRKFHHVTPIFDDSLVPRFVRSTAKTVEKVIEHRGRKIKTFASVPVVEVIPDEEFENRGIDCSLFSVENLLASGTDLFKMQPITTPFFSPSLEALSDAREQLDNFTPEQLTEKDFEEPSK